MAVLGGAGAMGRATVFDLTRNGYRCLLLDADLGAAQRIARRYGAGKPGGRADARDPTALAARIAGRAAGDRQLRALRLQPDGDGGGLRARCHYLDLGGLFHTTRMQLLLDKDFKAHGLLAVLGMGSAPGIMNVMARAGADPLKEGPRHQHLQRRRRLHPLRGPGRLRLLPRHRSRRVHHAPDGLRPRPLSGARSRCRAARTSSSTWGCSRFTLRLHSEVATLPLSYRGKGIRECFFKIAYDPVLIERLKLLIDLGLTDRKPGPRGVAPRDVLLDCFKRLPPPPDFIDDRDCLAVVVEGENRSGPVTVRYDLTATPQTRPPLSAVARDTGFPPSIVARMILEGRIRERGCCPRRDVCLWPRSSPRWPSAGCASARPSGSSRRRGP